MYPFRVICKRGDEIVVGNLPRNVYIRVNGKSVWMTHDQAVELHAALDKAIDDARNPLPLENEPSPHWRESVFAEMVDDDRRAGVL
jgi:hypothetical protein